MSALTVQVVRDEEGRELGVMLFVPKGQWPRLQALLEDLEDLEDALAALKEPTTPYEEVRARLKAEGRL